MCQPHWARRFAPSAGCACCQREKGNLVRRWLVRRCYERARLHVHAIWLHPACESSYLEELDATGHLAYVEIYSHPLHYVPATVRSEVLGRHRLTRGGKVCRWCELREEEETEYRDVKGGYCSQTCKRAAFFELKRVNSVDA